MDKYLEIALGILALLILILPFIGKDFINKNNTRFINKITGFGGLFFSITILAAGLNVILLIRKYNTIDIENENNVQKDLIYKKKEEEHKQREILVIERMTLLEKAIKKGGYKYDSVKGVIIKPKMNIQRIDNHASGIQNNAPNYGNQAGRDLILTERILNKVDLDHYLSKIKSILTNNHSTCIVIYSMSGSNGGGILSQLKNSLIKLGYNPKVSNSVAVAQEPVENIGLNFNGQCLLIEIGTFE